MTISTLSFILAQAKDNQSGGSILSILILVLPMAALVYLMTVPQRKQRQKQADMLRKVEVGDEVLTNSGIVGTITFAEDDLFHLEVDDDVVIRIAKNAISKNLNVVEDPTPAKSRKGGLLDGALGGTKAAKGASGKEQGDSTKADSGASKSSGSSTSDVAKKGKNA